jgi:hypothetical protein
VKQGPGYGLGFAENVLGTVSNPFAVLLTRDAVWSRVLFQSFFQEVWKYLNSHEAKIQ